MGDLAYKVISGAHLAIDKYGFGFFTHTEWKANFDQFGALSLLYGTAVTSAMAMLLGVPIGVSIGLFLSLLAPQRLRGVIGPLVEMLAAIPSVILGLWGIIVLAPVIRDSEPWLHRSLGFLPIFGTPQTAGASVFTAGLILAIMVVPIVASISRDLFLTVPRELQDGAIALGATQWEVVRGVILPVTASGVVSASLLGLGRALGEAIAVAQVIGAGNLIHGSLFETGDTMASRIALQFPGALDKLHFAALFYLAGILLLLGLITNLGAQLIMRRFGADRAMGQ
jgi:phosphate transport system permease protein